MDIRDKGREWQRTPRVRKDVETIKISIQYRREGKRSWACASERSEHRAGCPGPGHRGKQSAVFSTIKRELVYQNHWACMEATRPDLYEYIEVFYNRKLRHSSNGYLSPVDYDRLVLSGASVAT